ncbi:uncharacterized protein LOC110017750 [Oryzias latipes]
MMMMMKASVALVTFFLLLSPVTILASQTQALWSSPHPLPRLPHVSSVRGSYYPKVLKKSCLMELYRTFCQTNYQPDVCCFNFLPDELHANEVMNIKHTSTHCAKKAVLLMLENKQEYCADLSKEWAPRGAAYVPAVRRATYRCTYRCTNRCTYRCTNRCTYRCTYRCTNRCTYRCTNRCTTRGGTDDSGEGCTLSWLPLSVTLPSPACSALDTTSCSYSPHHPCSLLKELLDLHSTPVRCSSYGPGTAGRTSTNSYHPSVCCYKFFPKKLHANVVENIKHTSTHCAKKAVLLTLKNKQEYCADPSMEWVKKLIKNFL